MMPSLSMAKLIADMRMRKRMKQTNIWDISGISEVTISRIVNIHQTTYYDTFDSLMGTLDLTVDTFFCPYLVNASMYMMQAREALITSLDAAPFDELAYQTALEILQELQVMEEFKYEINRQFILSYQVQLNEIDKTEPGEIIKLTHEGILLTYPEFNPRTFNGDMLLFEEPNLVHSQALAYARNGETKRAIALLQRIQEGLNRLPQDDKDKERLLARILLNLARILMETGEYAQALEVCEAGDHISVRRNRGKYTPDFMFLKAKLLTCLERQSEVAGMIRPAYFGFIALRKHKLANDVLAFAEGLGIEIDTYGAEKLPANMPEIIVERGEYVPCKSIGELIYLLRTQANMGQKELCKGICSVSSLSKIESGTTKNPSVYYLEAFMQRLGRHIEHYFYTFLSQSDFDEKQMRDEVRTLRVNRRYDEAAELLKKLESKKSYQKGINSQFVKLSWAHIYAARNGYDATHFEMFVDAWRVTQKDIDVERVGMMRLTNYEIVILNNIAVNLCENGELYRGLRMLENLMNIIKTFIVDGAEKMHMYPTVSYNYSKYLGNIKEYYKVIAISNEGMENCVRMGDLRRMDGFAVNYGWALCEMGDKEKSLPYLAMAHYVTGLFGRAENQQFTRQYVEEHFGITLN